jgi:hypothetical protein
MTLAGRRVVTGRVGVTGNVLVGHPAITIEEGLPNPLAPFARDPSRRVESRVRNSEHRDRA